MSEIVIYSARNILTMNPNRPEASHVAVREGRILGVGTLGELEGWGATRLDERFADKVLMPGLIEGHAHLMEGTLWRKTYCGYFDRTAPDGRLWHGLKSIEAVLARLEEAESELEDATSPLTGWQLDPIYMDNQRVTRAQLDTISTSRPIGVLHASGHVVNVNSMALEMGGLLKPGINHPGIPLGEDGLPTGELFGPEARAPVSAHIGLGKDITLCDEAGLRDFARICVRAGVTTSTDLAARLDEETLGMLLGVTGEADFPARIVPFEVMLGKSPSDAVSAASAQAPRSTDMLRLGRIKAIADGSIQGFSARLRWPGYYNGAPNGLWYTAPEHLGELYERALEAGVLVHTHTNGDQATELALDKLGDALRKHPSPDHRFTLQHCQLADAAQFRMMKKLGLCVNLFANHHFYWGDEHYRLTVGPERAERMNACRTAMDEGVPFAIHSDAPITPLGPLFTAWCAVNRITASGRIQGEHERIAVKDALRAITIGAAYTLHLDGELGSIEVGKRADFAVLEDDPTRLPPEALKDIAIWGTVQGGRCFRAGAV